MMFLELYSWILFLIKVVCYRQNIRVPLSFVFCMSIYILTATCQFLQLALSRLYELIIYFRENCLNNSKCFWISRILFILVFLNFSQQCFVIFSVKILYMWHLCLSHHNFNVVLNYIFNLKFQLFVNKSIWSIKYKSILYISPVSCDHVNFTYNLAGFL